MRITRESFEEIFDDVILADCSYAFGPEAQQINYLSDYGPVSISILYGNSEQKQFYASKLMVPIKAESLALTTLQCLLHLEKVLAPKEKNTRLM